MKRWPLVASFVLFIALCVSVAYWAMQLFKPPLRAVAAPPPAVQAAPGLDAATGLFGGRSTIAVATNFQLKGVIASGTASDSIAILATDGKPAQAVRANAEVIPGVTVKEVHPRYVLLSDGGVSKRVELPEDAKGQTRVDLPPNAPGRTAAAAPAAVPGPPPSARGMAAPSPAGSPPGTTVPPGTVTPPPPGIRPGATAAPQPTAPQPTAPQPTAPQPTAPQPTAPQPTAPQPTAPQPTAPQPTAPQPAPASPAMPPQQR